MADNKWKKNYSIFSFPNKSRLTATATYGASETNVGDFNHTRCKVSYQALHKNSKEKTH